MKKILPVLSIILAGVSWGCLSLFLRPLSNYGLSGIQITTLRLGYAAIIFGIILLIYNIKLFKIKLKDLWIFLFLGIICVGIFSILYFETVINSEVAVAVVLLYTSPIFVLILSLFIYKEKLTLVKVIAAIVTVVGCIFVSGIINGKAIITPMVLLTGLLAGLTYGLHNIFSKLALNKNYHLLTINFYSISIGLLVVLPFSKVSDTINIVKESPIVLLWGLGLSLTNAVLAYFLFTWGLKYIESSKASILVAVEPMVGSIIGMTIFKESHNIFKILGVVFIIVSIVIMNINWKKDEKN